MLRVEDRFVIHELHKKGVSISEIARATGRDRKTVRSVIAGPLVPEPKERKRRTRKLDPWTGYLEARIADGVLNAHKLYGEIRSRGYGGGETQVRAFVHPHREERRARREATVRFETEPGRQAQVDWGHFGYIEHHGRRRRLYAFVMTLGWSRASYLEYTVSMDIAWFLRCHAHAFRYLGGVPRELLHDNLKTAVIDHGMGGAVHFHPQYLDFAGYYGFSPRACRPYRAQTKGKVENGVKYVRGNFWVGLRYTDLDDLNRQARGWLDTVANARVHGTTGEVPFERLPSEELVSLGGKPDYDTSVVCHRWSSADCLISYEGNYYSVPASHARERLLVRETEAGELVIAGSGGGELTRHKLVTDLNQRVVVPAHYEGIGTRMGRPASRAGAVQVAPPGAEQLFLLDALPDAPVVEARPLAEYDRLAGVVR